MRVFAFCMSMVWCLTALASHSYGGLDLCTLYPEVMPPGMQSEDLPEPDSQGAILLQTYCAQCHALPGPGRHTAAEWPTVLDKMNLLMDVASRFGGLLGKVKVPAVEEEDVLRDYLINNALQPRGGTPRGLGAAAFTSYCGSCHALPDAGQHSLEEWPAVLKRMQRNMTVMKYTPPSQALMVQIQLYLQQNLQAEPDAIRTSTDPDLPGRKVGSGSDAPDLLDSGRWMALGPFLLLVLTGLVRWWQDRARP